MSNHYTPAEDAYLRDTSGVKSEAEQARHLGRTRDSVSKRRKLLGISAVRVRQKGAYRPRIRAKKSVTVKLAQSYRDKPNLPGTAAVVDIELAARAAGMSYGKYVAQEGL